VLDVTNLTPTIGSEVSADPEALLSGAYADELREVLVARGVIAMRGIDFDDDQLRAFSQSMGELRMGTVYEQENDGMLKIVDIPGAYFWHIDGTYTGIPPFATVLAPRVVAPEGGDTEFANTYAAFDDLPTDEQEYLKTLEVVHSVEASNRYASPEQTVEHFEKFLDYRHTQPLVWQHASGRCSLFIGFTASHVIGMHPADSHELLQRLIAHATQDKYVYRHRWAMGDLVMWDNTGTMHRVRPFDLASGRLMHRFTLEGFEPVRAPAAAAATA
jgi:alpha-ketoglutarate-dependent taurine dioxygenase